MKKPNYMVNIWGGAWNKDANPSIEKELWIKEGAYYFDTEEHMNKFIKTISQPKYKDQGMMIETHTGNLTHKRTIFVGKFTYQSKEFIIRYDFGYEYDDESAEYMFTMGNYACDCNRSLIIRRQYGKDAIPELGCGDEIELVGWHIEYED